MAQGGSYTLNTIDRPAVMAVDLRNGRENPDINGTLQAKDNGGFNYNCQNVVRQTDFGFVSCGNPWDTQSQRVYQGDGAWHSLTANENGGQSRDAICVETS